MLRCKKFEGAAYNVGSCSAAAWFAQLSPSNYASCNGSRRN